jgi:hypothetical protein
MKVEPKHALDPFRLCSMLRVTALTPQMCVVKLCSDHSR